MTKSIFTLLFQRPQNTTVIIVCMASEAIFWSNIGYKLLGARA